jgi:hypothetical protein
MDKVTHLYADILRWFCAEKWRRVSEMPCVNVRKCVHTHTHARIQGSRNACDNAALGSTAFKCCSVKRISCTHTAIPRQPRGFRFQKGQLTLITTQVSCSLATDKTKLKLSHYTPRRRLGGEELQLLLILDLGARRECVVRITPRQHPPGERTPGTHCTGGWVGPRAGLDTEARGKYDRVSTLDGLKLTPDLTT